MDPLKKNRELDALFKYSQEYLLKKKKSGIEKQFFDEEKRYVIYARKSTEDDDRQVQSIEDQIENCQKYAKDNNLQVVEIITEQKSAKIAGKRVRFKEILEGLSKGTSPYNSILAWHPDRLARNMKESGEILDLLDNDKLVDLKFPSHSFTNDAAGKMTLSILFAMAKEFSDKLSVDTKRGIKKKVEQGLYCGSKKRGYYVSDKTSKFKPNDSFKIYKDVWKMALRGEPHSIIKAKYPDENIPVSNYLKDPFPAGIYCYGDQIINICEVEPTFTPMITPEEFLTVQRLARKRGGWHKTDDYLPFRDMVMCSNCNNYMVPGRSANKQKVRYLYVTCGNENCKQSLKAQGKHGNSIRGQTIVDSALSFLRSNLEVSKELYDETIRVVKKRDYSSIDELKKKLSSLKSTRTKLTQQENKLSSVLINKKVVEDFRDGKIIEVLERIKAIDAEINKYEKLVAETETKIELDLPSYEDFVNFFKDIVGTIETNQEPYLTDSLLRFIFLNFSVGDKKVLSYELNEPFKTYWSLKNTSGVDNEQFCVFALDGGGIDLKLNGVRRPDGGCIDRPKEP